MKHSRFWMSAGFIVFALMMSLSAMAATDAWIGTAHSSDKINGDFAMGPGGAVELALYFTSDFSYNVADFVVGFDTSDATKHGTGIGTPQNGYLSLMSTSAQINSSINTGVYDMLNYVNIGSGREINAHLGGRVYGFNVIAGKSSASVDQGIQKLFTFTIQNSPADFGYSYIVISVNPTGGASWTSALKSAYQNSVPSEYAMKVYTIYPEPGAIISLFGGLMGFAALALRRRG